MSEMIISRMKFRNIMKKRAKFDGELIFTSLCFFLFLIMFASISIAVQPKVLLLNLQYDNGKIMLLNSTVKYGFFPDRRYIEENAYKLDILKENNNLLYSFNFKSPNVMYLDGTFNGTLTGGILMLNNTEFSLDMPYYSDMKQIRIYSPRQDIIGEFDFGKKAEIRGIWISTVVGAVVIFVLLLILLIGAKKKKKIKPNN